jgi:hypothetical protein
LGRRRGSGSSATTCSAISAGRSPRRRQSSGRAGWRSPRSGPGSRRAFFLSQLHAHHQVEDLSYFPLFRAAEPRLLTGFEVLERDHAVLHETIARLAGAANAFLRAGEPDALRASADRYARVTDELLSGLMRHLGDEEDLIIPLILDRGEGELGMG